MRRFLLSLPILPVFALAVVFTGLPVASQGSDNSSRANSSTISGRVLDAATRKPVAGTVVVALESQPGDGSIVNATSPDANGNFSFTAVRPGSYAIVVSGLNAAKQSYTPVLVVGKGVIPGAKLGTIALKSSGAKPAQVDVPVQSDRPITVTLAVNQKVGQYSFAVPWADGTPTFDTSAKQGCSGGAACNSYRLQVPAAGMLMANFDGKSVQYLPQALAATYSVSATAYTQNGAKQTCESHTSAPQDLTANAALQPITFSACE
jgi:hypothetical protein